MKETCFADICLDFDGVLHSYESGWIDADKIPDPPVDGAIETLYAYLDAGLTLAILSVRSALPGGIQAMREWLGKHDREYRYQNRIPHDVPTLNARIDALQWTTLEQTLGKRLKLNKFPKNHKVKVFRVVSSRRTDYVTTNALSQSDVSVVRQVCDVRWED